MEGHVTKLFEKDSEDGTDFWENQLRGEDSEQDNSKVKVRGKTAQELSREEETLKKHLDELKKENFTLQASLKAWQTTLKNKLDEFKEADFQLDQIHQQIWSEREKFCSKADDFNSAYGILSDWWETQLKFVNELENLESKSSENRKRKQEIQNLEKEVEELKKEIDGLREKKEQQQQLAMVEVHATAEGDAVSSRFETANEQMTHLDRNVSGISISRNAQEDEPQENRKTPKKIRYSDPEEGIEPCEVQLANNALYSMLDLDKVRMVNRSRNRFRRNYFFGKVKKLLTHGLTR